MDWVCCLLSGMYWCNLVFWKLGILVESVNENIGKFLFVLLVVILRGLFLYKLLLFMDDR